jgi:hypothetical protein
VSFDGTDAVGNSAPTVTSTSVIYDSSAPVFSNVSPATSATINSANVGYTLSEDLDYGSVTFTQTGGSADASSPHFVSLTGAELKAGSFSGDLINAPTLVDGSIYSVSFDGTDAGGNSALTVTSTSVTYDATNVKPKI